MQMGTGEQSSLMVADWSSLNSQTITPLNSNMSSLPLIYYDIIQKYYNKCCKKKSQLAKNPWLILLFEIILLYYPGIP